jgi:hypothetical protein
MQGFGADMGGTEILAPLAAIFSNSAEIPRSVYLLTDGAVSNPEAVI